MNSSTPRALVGSYNSLDDVNWGCSERKNVKPKFVELNKKAVQGGDTIYKDHSYQDSPLVLMNVLPKDD